MDPALPSKSHYARDGLFVLLACALALAIFHPVRRFEFLNFDDDLYLVNNPWLKQGFTWASAQWALSANFFTFSIRAEYWSPLTLLTRLFDAEFFGMNPGAHHVTSAAIHLVNCLVLFVALRSLTFAWRRSAVVALLFLVHPLNVEPVAWLSARKDLVSATFFFLTLAAYGRYARVPSRARYALVALAFAGGLMSKPMVVTLPALLLVLDGWPLGRWAAVAGDRAGQWRLAAEKLPLLLLAGMVGWIAMLGQQDWGAIQSTAALPLPLRVGNAVISYATILRRTVWPHDLAIYYPHPGGDLAWPLAGASAGLLLILTVGAFLARKRYGFLLSGWLWFLGLLAPVIGLMQIGNQATADRYAYLAVVGLFVAAVWGGAELLRNQRVFAVAAVAAVIAGFAVASAGHVPHYRDSIAAFTRALAVTKKNDVAHLNLGSAYFLKNDFARARTHFRQSLELRPVQSNGWNNLAAVEAALGNADAAMKCYDVALQINPRAAKSHFHLGKLLLQRDEKSAAEKHFRQANDLEPGWAEPYAELSALLRARGESAEADRLHAAYEALVRR